MIILFELNRKAGFYSEFFFLCWAYIHSKAMRCRFYITHKNWTYTFKYGWHDYFDSLEVFDPREHAGIDTIIFSHSNMKGIPNYPLSMYVDCIKEIYLLKPYLLKESSLLQCEKYAALVVRRGDKLIADASFISTEDIISITNIDSEKNIFVQSDDFRVVADVVKLCPSSEIVSIVPPTSFGSYHGDSSYIKNHPDKNYITPLTKKTPDEIFDQTKIFLVGLDVCIHADVCWVDSSSNVSRFMKLASMENVQFYPKNTMVDLTRLRCPAYFDSLFPQTKPRK